MPEQIDLLVEARWVIPVEPEGALESHSVAVHRGRILDVLPTVDAHRLYSPKKQYVLRNHALMPGFVNAHTHAAMALMRGMAAAGEVDALVAERVWQEFARGLMEPRPSRMFEVLRDCGALARLLPELDRVWEERVARTVDGTARANDPLPVRFAALAQFLGNGTTAGVESVCARLRVPGDCRDLALIAARERHVIPRFAVLRPDEILELLERCDALRRPDRFAQLLDAGAAEFAAHHGADRSYPPRAPWLAALNAARTVDAGAIAARQTDPRAIAGAVRAARIAAIAAIKN
jgi:tRNA nucleotidyltransferase (CCA-adding enzyme)